MSTKTTRKIRRAWASGSPLGVPVKSTILPVNTTNVQPSIPSTKPTTGGTTMVTSSSKTPAVPSKKHSLSRPKNPQDWKPNDVRSWILEIGRPEEVAGIFEKQGVDGDVLLDFEEQDLRDLGLNKINAKSVFKKVTRLRATFGDGLPAVGKNEAGKCASPDKPVEQKMDVTTIETPDEFCCPISCNIMEDPVIAQDGHTYERKEIETWLEKHDTSPTTNLNIDKNLIPNFALKGLIADWKRNDAARVPEPVLVLSDPKPGDITPGKAVLLKSQTLPLHSKTNGSDLRILTWQLRMWWTARKHLFKEFK